ncbi:xylulokinase [Chelativorans salis]|uniref:FGGY family carbohydrate kinase n=1 Tax=Chelativorans salis TaxID=2978478 RepID=A0ABT2LUW0_9HYPH|nr:FGGY family carbohydrate kinase [Chelativorans sp. EGI FJ00035]MCT7378317.1 FGGY family carbohydrate kinase [Chelativorans sp. EGI FJ00035]
MVVDVGSSALKAVVFGEDGTIRAVASHQIKTRSGADRSQEQHPEDWWSALKAALAEIADRKFVAAIAFTGSMQNLIPLASDGLPLGPAALYSDRRLDEADVSALCEQLPEDYAQRTGNHFDPAHTILKLMRVERFLPDAARGKDVRWAFGAKDAVTFRLTAQSVTDPTTASTTGLMNMATCGWDGALLKCAGQDTRALPKILPANAVVGPLLPAPANELGLPAGIPIYNGAGDAAAATWGAFADRPGAAYAYLGTTGWVAATLPMREAAPPRTIYTLADPVRSDHAIIISPFLTAGAAMDWLAELVGKPVDALLGEVQPADRTPPAPLFLPYLSGERAPFEDQRVRGAFLGLDRVHDGGALAYAVMEGIAFAVRHNLEHAGLPPSPLTIIGGAARHILQQQMLADALKREISIPDDSLEMTALGVLRMVASKAGITVDDDALKHASKSIAPHRERIDRADRRYQAYMAASDFAREQAARLG